MTVRSVLMPLFAAMLVAGMGDGRAPPPPVALPGDAAVPGAGLNRPGAPATAAENPPAGQTPPAAPAAPVLRIIPAAEADPAMFQWQERVIAVFADTAADPSFVRQLEALNAQPGPLIARDVVVVTDADPAGRSLWRQRLRPEGFSLLLIDKDGQVKARKPLPWTVREIVRTIDKFPSRLEEIGRAGLGL